MRLRTLAFSYILSQQRHIFVAKLSQSENLNPNKEKQTSFPINYNFQAVGMCQLQLILLKLNMKANISRTISRANFSEPKYVMVNCIPANRSIHLHNRIWTRYKSERTI